MLGPTSLLLLLVAMGNGHAILPRDDAPSLAPVLPPAPAKTKALTVYFESSSKVIDGHGTRRFNSRWLFYGRELSGLPEPCLGKELAWRVVHAGPGSTKPIDMPAWPSNPEINDNKYKDRGLLGELACRYMNDGTNAGRLFCPSVPGGIECKEDPNHNKPENTITCSDGELRRPVAFCEW